MRFSLPMMVLVCAVFAFAEDKKAPPLTKEALKELQSLQGEWVVTELGRAGEVVAVKDEKEVLQIKNARWIFDGVDKGEVIALDPKANPKCFDLKSIEQGRKGEIDEGIYKLEGDTLTVCYHQGRGKQRPTRFETKAENPDTILAVLKRVTNP